MFITQLSGGLGNQMFQAAAGLAAALRNARPWRIDASLLVKQASKTQNTPREYALDLFPYLNARHAPIALCHRLAGHWPPRIRDRIRRKINGFPYVIEQRDPPCYDHRITENITTAYLIGYWQSERYFIDRKAEIRKALTLPAPRDEMTRRLQRDITTSNAIGLHIRRGDYITNPAAAATHGTPTDTYWDRALHYLDPHLQRPLVVVSDDPAWCHKRFQKRKNTLIIDSIIAGPSGIDHMNILSSCKDLVIANSTFSWWAAWLRSDQSGQVIAPTQWYADPIRQSKSADILPKSWMQL